MPGQPDLDVVGLLRGKAHVAGAQRHHPVMQIELPQHFLGAGQHPLMLVAARLGRGDRHQLDLGELMLPDHAAGIAAGGARLGAKTRRQRRQPHRQFFFLDDGFADEVGQRHFGGGDEPQSLPRAKHVFGGLRQVTRAIGGLFAHQQRRIDLGVTVLVGVEIEHELPDRALEPRQAFFQHDKARAG